MEKDRMTVQEALSNGYTHYTYENGETAFPLSHIKQYELLENNIFLMGKEASTYKVSGKEIKEYMADIYYNSEEHCDDTNDMDDHLNESIAIFDEFAAKVNEIFAKKVFYLPTDIQVVL